MTNLTNRLNRAWDRAANASRTDALRDLREAFELDAIGCDLEAELALVNAEKLLEQPDPQSVPCETALAPMVIDSFAGGGGASTGLEAAGLEVDVAVNHCGEALAMHKKNHPNTLHLEEDVWAACKNHDLVTLGRPVGVLWASPDCRHFSRARGSRPVSTRVRSLAWTVVKWAKAVKPRIIFLENVPEFEDWGPLSSKTGQPIKARKGELFRRWRRNLEKLGYVIEWRVLDAADYGVPTHRRRLYLVARCDGAPIVWPEATHGPGRAQPYRTAAECIDWSIPGRSIFGRKKPLADATLMRIAKGLRKYVLEAGDDAFIVRTGHAKADGSAGMTMRGQRLAKPLGTVCSGNDKALIIPWVTQGYGGGPNGKTTAGKSVAMPLPAITRQDHNWLAEAHVQEINERLPDVDEVRAFLVKYYSNGVGQPITEPLHTITSQDRFGIVEVHGREYQIVDITLRMLEPHELAAAQGFPRDYALLSTKKASVAKIGNSVCPPMAQAIAGANVPAELLAAAA